jgi:hypothetical protein
MTQSIDLTNFSLQDLQVLEEQIARRKSLLQFRTYKVSFEVTFDVQSHSHDKLAPNGYPCTTSFFGYLQQLVVPTITQDFDLDSPEGVGRMMVDLLPSIAEHSHGN